MLPWLTAHVEEHAREMGEDYWSYGFTPTATCSRPSCAITTSRDSRAGGLRRTSCSPRRRSRAFASERAFSRRRADNDLVSISRTAARSRPATNCAPRSRARDRRRGAGTSHVARRKLATGWLPGVRHLRTGRARFRLDQRNGGNGGGGRARLSAVRAGNANAGSIRSSPSLRMSASASNGARTLMSLSK